MLKGVSHSRSFASKLILTLVLIKCCLCLGLITYLYILWEWDERFIWNCLRNVYLSNDITISYHKDKARNSTEVAPVSSCKVHRVLSFSFINVIRQR